MPKSIENNGNSGRHCITRNPTSAPATRSLLAANVTDSVDCALGISPDGSGDPHRGFRCTIHRVVGETNMSKILDAMTASDLSAIVKKIDPHSSHVGASADPRAARSHIADLATGRVEPSLKPERVVKPKAIKAPKVAPPKIGGILDSKVHSGRPKTTRPPAKKQV